MITPMIKAYLGEPKFRVIKYSPFAGMYDFKDGGQSYRSSLLRGGPLEKWWGGGGGLRQKQK
jgi:hypothetical protein